MDWKADLAETTRQIMTWRKAAPEGAAGFTALATAAMAEGAVSTLNKELICIGIGISQKCLDCIGYHVKAAIRLGATREQIAEVASVATYMGGGPAHMYSVRALEAFDQLSA
ncbi:MAG: carboxymuconolactone decarboxylase family protein [Rubellimicrobium sp.]|nr:carboxymuconolactone decarboxylase family protein [Rubellimicrobium sp.]